MNIHVSNTGSLRENTELSIMEEPLEWLRAFQDNWLAHLEKTGETNWSVYSRVKNKLAPSGKAVQLSHSRLLFITSSGAFIPGEQDPFDEFNPLGDYSVRLIPCDIPLDQIDFSHAHMDQSAVRLDPQTLLPLTHLQNMVDQGKLGSLVPIFISFNGYHPHAIRVVKELIPTILRTAKKQQANAAFLAPIEALCVQSAGLIARALEVNGIASAITTNNRELAKLTAPPRATISKLPSGSIIGKPGEPDQQRQLLEATLALLEKNAPLDFVPIQ
jgi:D-proline reductase (dithiol) PrdB